MNMQQHRISPWRKQCTATTRDRRAGYRWLAPGVLLLALAMPGTLAANSPPNAVVATVNGHALTLRMLNTFVSQFPFASASLSGPRFAGIGAAEISTLVDATLLAEEAQRRGLDQRPDFRSRMGFVRTNLAIAALTAELETRAADRARQIYATSERVRDPAQQVIRLHGLAAASRAAAEAYIGALGQGATFGSLAMSPDANPCGVNGRMPLVVNGMPRYNPSDDETIFRCVDNEGDLGAGQAPPEGPGFHEENGVPVVEFRERLGNFPAWPASVAAAVASLQPGDMSKPVEVDGKWFIFRLDERRPPSFDEVGPQIQTEIAKAYEFELQKRLDISITPAGADTPDGVKYYLNRVPVSGFDVYLCCNDTSNWWDFPSRLAMKLHDEDGPPNDWELNVLSWRRALDEEFDRWGLGEQPRFREDLGVFRTILLILELEVAIGDELLARGAIPNTAYPVLLLRDVRADTIGQARALQTALRRDTPARGLQGPLEFCALPLAECATTSGRTLVYQRSFQDPVVSAAVPLAPGQVTDPIPAPAGQHGFYVLAMLDRDVEREYDADVFSDKVGAEIAILLPRLRATARIEPAKP